MIPFLEEAGIEATFEAHWGQDVSCLIDLGAMEFRVGQGSIHTLNMALQAWTQVRKKSGASILLLFAPNAGE